MTVSCGETVTKDKSLRNIEKVETFMGNWAGDGTADNGQYFEYAAQVIVHGDGQYRINIIDAFDTKNKPMHILDGTLKGSKYVYSADNGQYEGQGTLKGQTFEAYYEGSVSGLMPLMGLTTSTFFVPSPVARAAVNSQVQRS